MRRSFVKGQNGVRGSPDVKISEEQSDKSGTDPEDTDENYSQADITDYRNYEQIFRLVIIPTVPFTFRISFSELRILSSELRIQGSEFRFATVFRYYIKSK